MRTVWIFLGAALVAGCGVSSSTTITDADGNKVTATQDGSKTTFEDAEGNKGTIETDGKGGSMTIEGPDGKTTMEAGKGVTEAELGIAFYPGSTEKAGASFKVDTATEKAVMSIRLTADEPSKVVAYYKSKITEATTMSASDNTADRQVVAGKLGTSTIQVSAIRESGKSETEVTVAVTSKPKG